MRGDLQAKISPPLQQPGVDFNTQTVKNANPPALDSTAKPQTSFKDLMANSNMEVARQREAKGKLDLSSAKNDEEFFKMLNEKTVAAEKKMPSANLDKDAFLKLFIAQLQNQDPLSPKDSSEMASQMAQFRALETSMNINDTLEKLVAAQSQNRAVGLVDFIGKEVSVDGGKLRVQGGKVQAGEIQIEQDVVNSTLEVRDSSGTVIATQDMGQLKRGVQKLAADPKTADGKPLPDGVYTFAVDAKDIEGSAVPVKLSSTVKVTGVDLQAEGGSFYTDLGEVTVDRIVSVGKPGFNANQVTPAAAPAVPPQQAADGAVPQTDVKDEKAAEAAAPAPEVVTQQPPTVVPMPTNEAKKPPVQPAPAP
jgi:flagellar basal-body rod modification protein FlgD